MLDPAPCHILQRFGHSCRAKGTKGAREKLLDPRDLDRLSGRARVRLGDEQTYQEMLPAVIKNYGQVKMTLTLTRPCSSHQPQVPIFHCRHTVNLTCNLPTPATHTQAGTLTHFLSSTVR